MLDNFGTHKTAMIYKWLGRGPRYRVHFMPTSSLWTYQVERWLAEITSRHLRRGTYRGTQALERAIKEYLEVYN